MRNGEAREQGEVEEVEKARQGDGTEKEEEEEELMRMPSPIAKPTLCIFSFLKSLNITSSLSKLVVFFSICVDSVATGRRFTTRLIITLISHPSSVFELDPNVQPMKIYEAR